MVVCLGTQNGYSYDVTRLPHEHVDGVELRKTSYGKSRRKPRALARG